ncbi:MAG TPA: sulfatase-like hydrolase/transferase [Patescibacteria group bacterium]|nr:sulfatase-like hydrolase/transferase [Patescibacteria group bacterium]
MNPAARRARAAQWFVGASLLVVTALLGILVWRLTPPEERRLQRPRRGVARGAMPEDVCLVLITVDGLRADRLGSYGEAPLSPTLQIDRLASEGFRFEQAMTPSPASFPAHAAILTGFSPIGSPGLLEPGAILPAGRATLAEILKASGFTTAAFVGSTGVGRASGLARGFERFDEPRASGQPATLRWLAARPAREVIEAARGWLDESFRHRFFLWVQLADPSSPRPAAGRPGRRRDSYDAELEITDGEIGRLLSRVASLGVMGHTIVVVAGSHGSGLGEHGETGAGIGLYDTTLRVPLILRLPGVSAHDRSIPEQVRLQDLMPTLLELIRLAAPETPEGTSLVPLLDPGGALPPLQAVAVAGLPRTFLGAPAPRALRAGGWKLIEGAVPELYDLRRDPSEARDLARTQTARVGQMLHDLGLALSPAANAFAHGDQAGVRADPAGGAGTTGDGARGAGSVTPPAAPPAAAALLEEGLAALRQGEGARARRAIEDLGRLLAPGGAPPAGLLALQGAVLRIQGRVPEALAADEAALAALEGGATGGAGHASPLAGLLQSEIGACGRLQGRPEAALAAYRAAASARPDDMEDRLTLADLLVETGSPDMAIDELRGALARAPDESTLLAGLGRAYLAAGQPAAAILPLQDALRLSPAMTRPWFDLGQAYEALARPADALRAYQDFQARVPEPRDALFEQAAARVRALRGS